jgi:hypothetical protein
MTDLKIAQTSGKMRIDDILGGPMKGLITILITLIPTASFLCSLCRVNEYGSGFEGRLNPAKVVFARISLRGYKGGDLRLGHCDYWFKEN